MKLYSLQLFHLKTYCQQKIKFEFLKFYIQIL
jgi:hypothetical protein